MTTVLFGLAALGVGLALVQYLVLRAHLARRVRLPRESPPISVLKPLCGVDDDLEENLRSFAAQDYPDYEVLLGLRDRSDPAWPLACRLASERPGRFRVVLQRGEPGLNPKVNQLATLEAEARHDVLVVSDSNVRAPAGYLRDVARHLSDPGVGLVTHPVCGIGEETLGAALDNLQASAAVGPATVAAKRIAGRDVVVGKSMAMRRGDLDRLGGFASVKDFLAEDYVLGLRISSELGKRVAIGDLVVPTVNRSRDVRAFLSRYRRWAVMQRKLAGAPVFATQLLLYPLPFALVGLAVAPGALALAAAVLTCVAKAALDGATARALRGHGFGVRILWLSPLKDLLFLTALARALAEDGVEWRGNRLLVGAGSRLSRPGDPESGGVLALGR